MVSHLMPIQQHLIMDLPALWTIPFLHGNGMDSTTCRRVHVGTRLDGLVYMDSMLAYGHQCQCSWPGGN